MQLPRAYQMIEVKSQAVTNTAVNIPIDHRVFMISNPGAQPLYFNPGGVATSSSFLVPAGTVFPQYFSCPGNLSIISNATGTTACVLYLDV